MVVSDGTVFYVNELNYIYKWDGQNTEEIWRIDSAGLYYMIIMPRGLYCMPTGYKGVSRYSFLFYDFETGEIHQFY